VLRIVVDTNVIVSGLLWRNAPRRILDEARSGGFQPFTSTPMLDELTDVLSRRHLMQHVARTGSSAIDLVAGWAAIAHRVVIGVPPRIVVSDPDDDAVIETARAAQAVAVVTGDRAMLSLDAVDGIRILTPSAALELLTSR
jgi:hypothetical protein